MKFLVLPLVVMALLLGAGSLWYVGRLSPEQVLAYTVMSDEAPFPFLARMRVKRWATCPWAVPQPQTPIGFLMSALSIPNTEGNAIRNMASELIAKGCSVDQYSANGYTPLQESVLFNHAEAAHFLLDHGANPTLGILALEHQSAARQAIVGMNALQFAKFLSQQSVRDGSREALIAMLEQAMDSAKF